MHPKRWPREQVAGSLRLISVYTSQSIRQNESTLTSATHWGRVEYKASVQG